MQIPSFVMQNSSFVIQKSSFLLTLVSSVVSVLGFGRHCQYLLRDVRLDDRMKLDELLAADSNLFSTKTVRNSTKNSTKQYKTARKQHENSTKTV